MKRARVGACLFLASGAVACVPSLSSDDATISSTRILAVRGDPAEAPPGTKVTFTAFVAGTGGQVSTADVGWDFCTAPLPLTSDAVVSDACLGSASIVAAGAGPAVTAATPSKGCSLFGPETPPGGFRPPDPDATGGYYQPLRADLAGAAVTFALARIHCDLANADAQAVSAFAAAYEPNQNPTLSPMAFSLGLAAADPSAIPAGATVTLTASWPASSAETYAYYDPSTQAVTTKREAMQVAWYSTTGALATEATGRTSADLATSSANTWVAPSSPGTSHLFVVLRDDRGGVDFTAIDFTVTE
jgi:hypothetical protein